MTEDIQRQSRAWLITLFEARDVEAASVVRAQLLEATRQVVREQGLCTYVVTEDPLSSTTIWVIEEWASRADADAHEQRVGESGALDQMLPHLTGAPQTHRTRALARISMLAGGAA